MVLKRGGDVFLPTDSDLANLVGRTHFHSNNDLFYNLLGFEIYRRRWTNSHIPTQALSQHTFLHGTAAALLCQNGMPGFQEILDIGFPCASVCVGAYIDIILVQFSCM